MLKKRDAPLQNIIQYHKKVFRMNHEDFFSLSLGTKKELQSYRLTLIDNFIFKGYLSAAGNKSCISSLNNMDGGQLCKIQ
ncbi:hypothetical protein CUN85_07310 [Methanolobus halotolerans]|uniref:Uncharacterized protein n=1 Tax=Methanolobus halotolerans TaxID=2052935 RepID=A0A4E0PX30_9EURY|nr:hypothetical protein CUN85_07310 [Methanolobus halotolerans]